MMAHFNLIDPVKAGIQTATAAGSFVTLMITRRFGWAYALTLFLVGQVTAFYFTIPVAELLKLNMEAYGAIGFSLGLLALILWSGIIGLAQAFTDDPPQFVKTLLAAWRRGK